MEKHHAQSKAKQSKSVRELNLLNNHCWYMDENVLPGTQTLTHTILVSIRPPRPGTEWRIYCM